MSTTRTDEHLTDGEIVRAIDDENPQDEREHVRAHLETCVGCAARMRQLRHRQSRLTDLLGATDFEVPAATQPPVSDIERARARRRPPLVQQAWFRAAAALMLVTGAVLMFTPVQAMVVDWVRTQWSRIFEDAPAATTPAPAQVPLERGSRVQFTHERPEFRVVFEAATGGTLTVNRSTGVQASADANRAGVEFVVLPEGLRVIHADGAAADYEVSVPGTVSQVTVVVGGATVAQLTAAQLQLGTTLRLR